MADNLTISIGADATQLRAQLAVAQSEMRAFTRELNSSANAARKAGNDNALAFAKVGQAAAQVNQAAAAVAKLKSEMGALSGSLSGELTSGFARMGAGIREPLDALAMMSSRLRQTAEIAGITFAVDKLLEFTKRMGELGEKTVYMAAATGQTPGQFSLLTGALRLAGGESENASRTIEILGKNLQEALTSKTSAAAKAITSLGITQGELQRASGDTGYALDLLADKWTSFQNDLTKTADFKELLGRSFETLIPLLTRGSEGMEEFKNKARETGMVLSTEDAQALADTGEKVHLLGATLEGAGVRGFLRIRGAINTAIDGLTSFVTMAENAINKITELDSAAEHDAKIRAARGIGGRTTGATVGPSGHWIFRAGRMRFTPYPELEPVPGDNLPFTLPPTDLPPAAAGDWSDRGKPRVTPWPKSGGGGSKGAAPITDLFALADSAAEAQIRIDAAWLSAFKATQQAAVDAKTITTGMMLTRDIVYTAELEVQNQARLSAAMEAADAIVAVTDAEKAKRKAAQLKVWEQEMELSARAASAIAQDQAKIAEAAAQAAKKVADEFQKPFKEAFDKIGSGLETALTDALLHKNNKDWGKQLYESMVGDLVHLAGSALSKTATGLLPGSKPGEDLGTYLSRQLVELLTHTALLTGILGNTGIAAASSTAGAATSGISAAGSAGGLVGGLSTFATFLGFSSGGIVPSAAGGWALPSFPGMQPAMLHSREMVLPAPISEGLQDMIGRGGGGGDSHFHLHAVAADGPAVERLLRGNGRVLADVIRGALRSNALTPRTI